MKLTFEDLLNKEVMVVSEEHIEAFSQETLVSIKESIESDNITANDVEESLIVDILNCAKDINILKERFFASKTEEGRVLWRVISEKDVVILESYNIDEEKKDIILDSTCELATKEDDDVCEVKFEIEDNIEELLTEEVSKEEVLAAIKISMLLRLTFYIFTIKKLG